MRRNEQRSNRRIKDKECMYRTEVIEPRAIIDAFCNRIADLVVQKLKAKIGDKE